MRRNIAIVAATLLAISMANAQVKEPFSYKGVKLGDTMEIFQAALPLYACKDETCSFVQADCGRDARGVKGEELQALYKQCFDGVSFGGAPIERGHVRFVDGKLAYIHLTIETIFIDRVLSPALDARFGKPSSMDDAPSENRMGAKFSNWTKIWVYEEESMMVRYRAGTIDKGSVIIQGGAMKALERASRDRARQTGAKDF